MTISPFTIYLWQIADSINHSAFFISAVSFFSCAGLTLMFFYNQHCAGGGWQSEKNSFPCLNKHMDIDALNKSSLEENAAIKPWLVRTLALFLLSFVASTLLPSSKTIAMMVVIPKIADSKFMQQDAPEIYNAAVQSLKDALKREVMPEKNKP